MSEWLTQIFTAASGLPWWAMFVVILVTIACTKGIDAALKWKKAQFDERQYDGTEAREAREALVTELKDRIEKLETLCQQNAKDLTDSHAAHAKCEIQQAELKGEIRVQDEKIKRMELQIERLEKHEKVNEKHVEVLADAVKQIDGTGKG
jgi:predicted ribosome quality control (RQC) complex YloA/Tae2 family protein